MSHLPILRFRELEKILKKLSYHPVRQKGSHVIFANENNNTITVPNHRGRTIGKGLLKNIIKDLDLSVKDFIKIVKNS